MGLVQCRDVDPVIVREWSSGDMEVGGRWEVGGGGSPLW